MPTRRRVRSALPSTIYKHPHRATKQRTALPPKRSLVELPIIFTLLLLLLVIVCLIVIAALGSRSATRFIIEGFAPLVAGNSARGFTLGVVCTLLPAIVTYWWVFHLSRRRSHALRNLLIGATAWLGSAVPMLALEPPIGRDIDIHHPSAAAQAVATELPGAQFGAVVTFWATALVLGLVFLATKARRHRLRSK